ncbi:MAG TPA: DUF983 domain-containing protein [Planctomycetota bacterium]|jgi:uncharacterized protein (DUF983 family)|nr:DUF983 domain-containing protein [Planctomycetota bacterium]
MFESLFRMRESCPECSFRFTRETGYWLGAMYINYGVAVGVTILLHLVMTDGFQIPTRIQMAILIPLAVVLVLLFFGTSRALFLAMDLSWDPPGRKDYGLPQDAETDSDHGAVSPENLVR